MANPLFDRAPPKEFADRRQAFEFKAKVQDFPGLAEIIEADLATLDGKSCEQDWRLAPVDIRLRFGWADVQKTLPVLSGSVKTTVAAVCQRCLEAFEMPLAVDLDLLLVDGQGQDLGDDGREVWELEDRLLRPLDVIQETLIMALPFSAMHEKAEHCDALAAEKQEDVPEMLRPFADLKNKMNEPGP